MFFVPCTHGVAHDNIAYVYKLALAVKNSGYETVMLYSEKPEDFVGVEDWMGAEYADLEHVCVNDVHETWNVSPSDCLVVPDFLFPVMMKATQAKLPCQKILIANDIRYVFDSIELGQQLATFGVKHVIATCKNAAEDILKYFPSTEITILNPGLNDVFYESNKIREPYVMLLTEDKDVINRVAKGFYLRYPIFRFVTIRDSSHLPEEMFADALREASLVIFDNDNDCNGENILKALKCGCMVAAKLPTHFYDWMTDANGNLTESVIWYPEVDGCIDVIAGFVNNTIEDSDIDIVNKKSIDTLLEPYTNVDFNSIVAEAFEKFTNDHKQLLDGFLSEYNKD